MSLNMVFFLILMMGNAVAFGQNGYEPGYVVTLRNDTIHGQVKDRVNSTFTFPRLYNKIRFKPAGKSIKKYKPAQVRGYKSGNQEFETIWLDNFREFLVERYLSIPGRGNPVFMKVISRGYLTYYHWEYADQDLNTIEFVPLFKRADRPEMVRVTQGILGLKKKRMAEFFEDCPPLLENIESGMLKTPEAVMKFYNNWREAR